VRRFRGEKYEDALSKLEQLDGDYGARRNALVLRGEICQRLKRWEESKVAFHEALKIGSGKPESTFGPGAHYSGCKGL
jgi:predicted RNA polymerase sigma factor